MSQNVFIVSLGCNKNLVDTEVMMGYLSQGGYYLVNKPETADVIIINTCGFIESAKQEAIETIFEMLQYKKTAQCKAVIATGCLAQRYAKELQTDIPELDGILGVYNYELITEAVKKALSGQRYTATEGSAQYLNKANLRVLATPKYTAYLKISEGCKNHCHYCAIPSIRGRFTSRNMDSLISEAKRLKEAGVKELIVTAQDTTSYGEDLGKNNIIELLKRLSELDFKWIRLLYAYPSKVTNDLLEFMDKTPNICKYLDMPIQHTSNIMLHKMNRHYKIDKVKAVMDKIRSFDNKWAIRTSLIVGFPKETKAQFESMVKFITDRPFNHLGVFMFSPEEGTPAYSMQGQTRQSTKQVRYDSLMLRQGEIAHNLNQEFIGDILDVLIEGYDEDSKMYYGRTMYQAPDVDGKTFVSSDKALSAGDFVKAKIYDAFSYDIFGECLTHESGK